MAPVTLRPYQQECVELINALEGGAHLVQMATGLGKTVTFSSIARRGRVLILSHRDELVRQPVRYYHCPVGIEKAQETSHGEEVVSASVQTLARPGRLERFEPGSFDAVITDEAHHALASSYRKIVDHLQPRLHLGFTATPRRGDDRGLSSVFEDIVFSRDLLWGIEHGYLVDIDCHRVEVSWDTQGVRRTKGDYAVRDLDRAVNTAITNAQVARAYEELHRGQTLVFASSVAHAYALAELIGAQVIEGATPAEERRRILQAFMSRDVKAIVNCGVLTEGTDLPLVETVLLARPTQSAALYSQMVGRGLRLSPGKTVLRLIDCVGLSQDRQLCTAPSLVGMNEKDFPEGSASVDGLITGLRDRLIDEEDCLDGWVLRSRKVDVLWGSGIAWVRGFDGWRHVAGNGWSLTLAGPDDVDAYHARWWVRGEDGADERGSESFKTLRAAERWCGAWLAKTDGPSEQAALWDAEKVSNWAGQSATEKQMDYLRRLVGDEELGGRTLSRHEASVCIDRAKERARRRNRLDCPGASNEPRPLQGRGSQGAALGQRPEDAPLGTCPLCGSPLIEASGGRKVRCPSNRWRKRESGWYLAEGDGFEFWRDLGGTPLSKEEVRGLATLGEASLSNGARGRLERVPGDGSSGWRVKVVRRGAYGGGRA